MWIRPCLIVVAVLFGSLHVSAVEPVTPKGKQLASALDRMEVEKLWLKGAYVRWDTGEPLPKPVTDGKPHTHCSAFVAAASMKLGVYIQRPKRKDDPTGATPHKETLLANAQFDWLHGEEGKKFGWKTVADPKAAQDLANQGYLVVASFKEADAKKPGHIAFVRPSDSRTDQDIENDGPAIVQAGMKNSANTTLRAGFRNHPDAWEKSRGVRFFAHAWEPK
ncbi:MAG: hypothetical protein U0744_11380 [Gemmataceae bacterium]